MSATHLLSQKDILWKILEFYGHDPAPIFLRQGINREMMMKSGMRISYRKSHNLWEKASELIKTPCFGLRAVEYWHPSHFNALGYAWLASVTMREAFTRFDRYVHMITESTDTYLVENSEGLSVVLSTTMDVPAYMDLTMTILTTMCRLNLGRDFRPLAISFIHPELSCTHEYVSFFNAPVTFSADVDKLTISATDADRRLASGNKHLARLNDQYILRYLAGLNNQELHQRVKGVFVDLLPSGHISVKRVARRLNMSKRSLQRKLHEEGMTFSELVDEVRRELAEGYIRDPGINLMEVAFILGFSVYSSFSRAYKRWTGISPAEGRRKINLSLGTNQ